jgi:hypothetical protein
VHIIVLEKNITVENLTMFLRGNFDTGNGHTKSKFYQEILQSLYNLNSKDERNATQHLASQFIFYNKSIKLNKKIVYDEDLFSAGLWRVCDLFHQNGSTIPFNVWKLRGVTKAKFIVWRALLSCVRIFSFNVRNITMIDSSRQIILPTSDIIDVQLSSSKDIYRKIVKLKLEKPTALKSFSQQFPCLNETEIQNMYNLPRICTQDMAIKEFQYKILHKYLPINSLLYKMKKVCTSRCTFCNMYKENISHLFYECLCIKQLYSKCKKYCAKSMFKLVCLHAKM